MKVKELIADLKNYDENLEVYFGELSFYRLKDRGEHLQFEFDQTVFKDDNGNVIIEKNN